MGEREKLEGGFMRENYCRDRKKEKGRKGI